MAEQKLPGIIIDHKDWAGFNTKPETIWILVQGFVEEDEYAELNSSGDESSDDCSCEGDDVYPLIEKDVKQFKKEFSLFSVSYEGWKYWIIRMMKAMFDTGDIQENFQSWQQMLKEAENKEMLGNEEKDGLSSGQQRVQRAPYLDVDKDIDRISIKIKKTPGHHVGLSIKIGHNPHGIDDQTFKTNVGEVCKKIIDSGGGVKRLVIYFTGHGEYKTGNWIVKRPKRDIKSVLTFDDIVESVSKLRTHNSLIKIIVLADCCYSGEWVKKVCDTSDKQINVIYGASFPRLYGNPYAWDGVFRRWLCAEYVHVYTSKYELKQQETMELFVDLCSKEFYRELNDNGNNNDDKTIKFNFHKELDEKKNTINAKKTMEQKNQYLMRARTSIWNDKAIKSM